ncbi:hypothetical protein DYU11_19965 [Fibrisoma montanum]|uniref:Uncharacterized protein n=1 Tax=Fibrisoma montanum TaxID=2305895 RepID=A0A418M3K2_9BACT|nr:hypothetical protein [Fibrisoma montanum]RIV20330.1 hypothetical protein DYU11_19965 [Fibrisoma montanum]
MEERQGAIDKKGQSGKVYHFKYGWYAYRLLSKQTDVTKMGELPVDQYVAYLFLAGLLACKTKNDLPDGFELDHVYEVLDDLNDADAKEVYKLAEHALGFILESVQKMMTNGQATPADQQALTGTPS